MKNFLAWLKDEESGQGMVEYGLIIALVAVLLVATLVLFKDKIKDVFMKANSALGTTGS